MTWTTPRTWTTGEIPTAAIFNTHLRDQLLETCPSTATTAGDIVYADAASSMGSRLGIGSSSSVLVSDGSGPVWRTGGGDSANAAYTSLSSGATYSKLANPSFFAYPANVETTVTTGTSAVVFIKGNLRSDTAGAQTYLAVSVSGATTIAASDTYAMRYESSNANDQVQMGTFHYYTGLTAGSNKFTLEAKMSSGLSTLKLVSIYVFPL